MKRFEPVKNLMTKDVVTANLNDTYSKVKNMMDTLHVHHIPVLDGKHIKGMISRVDLLQYAHSKAYDLDERNDNAVLDNTISISDLMTAKLVTIHENKSIREAAEIIATNGFNSLPIINDEAELMGILTSKDLIGYLLEQY